MASIKGGSFLITYFLVQVMLMPGQSTARSFSPSPAQQSDFETANNGIRAVMFHRDHPKSPFFDASATTSDRAAASVKRSMDRSDFIARRLSGFTNFTDPVVNSNPTEEYLTEISIGTPPQTFSAIIDTGSDLIWVQCTPCTICPKQQDPLFDPTLSSTYEVLPCLSDACALSNFECTATGCEFQYSYIQNTSISGPLAQDTITVTDAVNGLETISNLTFGCTETNNASAVGDGIIGFGQGILSLPSQLNLLYTQVFSYCLVPQDSSTPNKTTTLLIGTQTFGNLSYTPIITNPFVSTFYYVSMTGITINGVDLGIPPSSFALDNTTGLGGVIFDSGTTFSMFTTVAINAIVTTLQSIITFPSSTIGTDQFPLCYDLSTVTSPVAPSMSFQFTDPLTGTIVDFPLSGDNMFIGVNDQGVVCLAFLANDEHQIIGNVQQADHFIEYDVLNQQIGFIQEAC